jgi:hypothetical protein
MLHQGMATPPEVPQLDKAKYPEAPWLSKFWELLRPFLERTTQALKGGLTHGVAGDGYQPGNLAAFYKEVRVPLGVAYPITFKNPLPGPAVGVVVWAARQEAAPDATVPVEGGACVGVDWQNASESGSSVVRIRALTGLVASKSYVVTLAVYGG